MEGGRWGRTLFQMLSKTSTPSWTFLRTRSISPCSFRLAPMAAMGFPHALARLGFTIWGASKGGRVVETEEGKETTNYLGRVSVLRPLRFSWPCLRGVTLARRNVGWTDVLSVREIWAMAVG